MNKFYTAAEISNALNVAKRTVQIRAKREGWPFDLIDSNGGKTAVYAIQDLPAEVANKLANHFEHKIKDESQYNVLKKEISTEIKKQNKQQSLKKLATLTGKSKERALAKASIVNLIQDFQKVSQMPKVKAIEAFCELYNKRHPSIDEKYFVFNSISRNTVLRWQKTLESKGVSELAGNYGQNKGKGIIDSNEGMKSYCLAMINQFPHIKGSELHKAIVVEFHGKSALPSPTTCRYWLKRWKEENASLYASLFDPSGWQNKFMAAFGSKDAEITRINQLWEFDSTPVDVMLIEGRYSILGVMDVFTRRVKLVLKPTSNAMGIACLIREALIDWGIPEIARTDNGADYLAHHIKHVWQAFDIQNKPTNPYSGWEKPYIERFFRTFSHSIGELLPGFIGHNVSDREKISARNTFAKRLMEKREKGAAREGIEVKLSAAEFQTIMDRWVNDYYHHAKHTNLGCSPFEKFTSHRQEIKTITDERVLDVLLAPVPGKGIRTVGKEGISVEGGLYIHAELGIHIGERVLCRYNPRDVGKIYVFHALNNNFICEAINTDIADQGITMENAQEARRIQRANVAAQRKEFKRLSNQHDVSDAAKKFLDYHAERSGNLTEFPKPQTDVNNPSIEAAKAAIEEEANTWNDEEINIFAKRRAEIELQKEIQKPAFTSPLQRAIYLTKETEFRDLPPADKAWLHQFRRDNKVCLSALDSILADIKAKKEIKK